MCHYSSLHTVRQNCKSYKPENKMDPPATVTQVFVCSLFIVLVLLSALAMCGEVEIEGEYNYDPESKNGPYHWGDIRPEWYKCKNGSMQSPIILQDDMVNIVVSTSGLQRNYQPSNATLMSTGNSIRLEWTGNAGHILINGTRYILQQCHWHSPSEHTINGIRYALEVHMVHKSSAGQIAVIGAVHTIGWQDPFLSSIEDDLLFIAQNKDAERTVGMVDPKQIIRAISNKYFRYNGSLTTPPCDENIAWTIFQEVKTVTWEQVRLLRIAIHDESYANARPLQSINDRSVQLYVSTDHQ